MKITGGIIKGKKISIKHSFKKKSYGIRPTSSKVREALFNIIGEKIKDANFVDLYGGTGVIGLEAISRGARRVIINEFNKRYVRHIKRCVEEMNFGSLIEVWNLDAQKFLLNTSKENKKFDIIFADPPYHTNEIDNLIHILEEVDVLNNDGIFVLEHFKKKILPDNIGFLEKGKEYRYGDTVLTIFRKVKK